MPRVLQLTDLHLFRDPETRLKCVPTWDTFREVCQHVKTNAGDWDLLVLTGDLAHDELTETYHLLREELTDWEGRYLLVPGNHDNRDGLRKVFPEITPPTGGFLSFAVRLGHWQILGLDSHWPGEVPGKMEPDQLAWFSEQLAQFADYPTLVFLHHPPVSVESPWLDEIALQNPEPLCEILQANPQIQAIATGHVHHAFQRKLGAADLFTSPSTGIQFDPLEVRSKYTTDPPGYRVFELFETGLETQVFRLPMQRFPPKDE